MPLDGWDHVELWVGNAKQAAYYYEHAFGFTQTAYAGRRPACATAPPTCSSRTTSASCSRAALRADSEIWGSRARTATALKDIALTVPAPAGLPPGRPARRSRHRRAARVEDDFGRVDCVDRDLRRHRPHLRQPQGVHRPVPARVSARRDERQRRGVGLGVDHIVGNVELGRMDHWVEFYERRLRDDGDDPLRRRPISTEYSALMSKVMTDGREDQVPDQRAGRGQAQEPDRGVPRLLPRPGRAAHRAADRRHRRDGRGAERAGVLFLRMPETYYDESRPRRRDRRGLGRPRAAADPRRPRRRGLPAADLHEDRAGPPDALLRGDRAPRRPGFGKGNFKALFEAIEREQALRGNL